MPSFQHLMKPSQKIDHILGNKTNLNKYKVIRIAPCILSNHQVLKLEVNPLLIPESSQTHGN